MTGLRCDACGRALAAEVAFCPYCGADRRLAPAPAPAPAFAPPEIEVAPTLPLAATATPVSAPAPPTPASAPPGAPPSVAAPAPAPAAAASSPQPTVRRKGGGCGLRLLILLSLLAAVLAWCGVHALRSGGPAPVPGAVAVRSLHVSRRWRTVALPGEAPATARFAVSSDTPLRVRAAGRVYALKPGRPLRLPEDLGDSIDVRAADYVSAADAARARVTLSTLRG